MNKEITIVILTKNEELNIQKCLDSLKDLNCRTIIVDSFSTDATVEISRKNNCEVYTHEFVSHGKQFNWALDNLEITSDWVLRIDADEVLTTDIKTEIVNAIENCDEETSAFVMKFKVFFMGKFLKHGGAYPFSKVNFFRTTRGRYDERKMHDNVIVSFGSIKTFTNDALHYDNKNIFDLVSKHNWYSSLEASNYLSRHNNQENLEDKAKRRQQLRGFYYRMPPFTRARLLYIYNYYFRLGFLDGKAGKIYAFICSYFYRYIIDAKIIESSIKMEGFNE